MSERTIEKCTDDTETASQRDQGMSLDTKAVSKSTLDLRRTDTETVSQRNQELYRADTEEVCTRNQDMCFDYTKQQHRGIMVCVVTTQKLSVLVPWRCVATTQKQ